MSEQNSASSTNAAAHKVGEGAQHIADGMKKMGAEIMENSKEIGAHMKDKGADLAEVVRDKGGDVMKNVKEKGGEFLHQAQDFVENLQKGHKK